MKKSIPFIEYIKINPPTESKPKWLVGQTPPIATAENVKYKYIIKDPLFGTIHEVLDKRTSAGGNWIHLRQLDPILDLECLMPEAAFNFRQFLIIGTPYEP